MKSQNLSALFCGLNAPLHFVSFVFFVVTPFVMFGFPSKFGAHRKI